MYRGKEEEETVNLYQPRGKIVNRLMKNIIYFI